MVKVWLFEIRGQNYTIILILFIKIKQ